MLEATTRASWRIFSSDHVLTEIERVLVERLNTSRRLAHLTRKRVRRRAKLVEPQPSRHSVPDDPDDSPILHAALTASVDYLVTNDPRLLELGPYEGLRIISMSDYYRLLQHEGLLG